MAQDTNRLGGQERLLLHVIEQFSRPLLRLSRMAELAQLDSVNATTADWHTAEQLAGSALQLAESYSLSLRLHGNLESLQLEPIAVSSLLYDAAHNISTYAKERGVTIELDTSGKLLPVLGDRNVLASALTSLGQVFVDAGAESEQPTIVRLGAHRSRYGIVTGLYSDVHELGASSLRQARQLEGKGREPMQRFVSGPAAGVFVADSLLDTHESRLHVARYHKLSGLAATLIPSKQLALV